MQLLFVALILLLNLAISWWNAKAVGNAWVEAKHAGGWHYFMCWMGALMSALGFTWCYLIILVFGAIAFDKITVEAAQAALYLGYILVIPGILFSGLMITIDSWARAYRERSFANVGVAGYNSFAQIYNTYHAVKDVPDAFKHVKSFFSGDSDDAGKAMVLLLVIVAALSGFITTYVIVSTTAAKDEPMPRQFARA